MTGTYKKARAVFLAIDSATASGVALVSNLDGFESPGFGEVRTQEDREGWAQDALEYADELDLPLVVVAEDWTPHGISTAAFASLNQSWGKWLAALEKSGVPDSCIVRVVPNTWRAAVLDKRRSKTREGLKRDAVAYVRRVLKMPPLSDNIAEALCLFAWAEHASEVHQSIAKTRKAAAAASPRKKKRKT